MQAPKNQIEVDNPYVYWRTAQEYEQSGDIKGAEIGYKAAVLAADNLPLAEYRRNFQEELSKHLSIPGYTTSPGVGPNELKAAYAELLTLPFAARVKLASFFARQNSAADAMQMCRSAMELKIDEWITAQDQFLDLRQQLDMVMRNLSLGPRRPAQTTAPPSAMSQRLLGKTQRLEGASPRSSSYNLPDISAMWEAHLKEDQSVSRQDLPPHDDQPLSIDSASMVAVMHGCLKRFIEDLPGTDKKRLGVIISQPAGGESSLSAGEPFGAKPVPLTRFHACTVLSTLSVRATAEQIDVHIVPTHDVLKLSEVETPDCLHCRYTLQNVGNLRVWVADNFPVYRDELTVALRKIFKDLLAQASDFLTSGHASSVVASGSGLAKKMSELDRERTNLVEKVVYQQEMVQNRIARDIHDSVIADILALKRSFEAHTVNDDQVTGVLEDVSQRLRNICSDLAPRDLQDWGLRTVVNDMATSLATRMKAKWSSNIAADLTDLPHQVTLHIYRIIQECFNNMDKHSRATEFMIDISRKDGIMVITIQDNGVGFDLQSRDTRKASQGGMGLDSIKERVELIRCFFPAQLWIQSQPGAGTKTTLQINTQPAQ
jgi:signal transduction histidine kinase